MNNHHSQGQQSSESKHDDDAALTDFLASLMEYTPTVPDELVEHYLGKSGFQCPDVRLTRLVAVATQKFVADIASDALQHCKARQASIVKDKRDKQQKDKRLILTMDDLSKALREMIDDKLPFIFPFSVWCQCEAPGVLRRQSFGWVGYCH
ncbi:transcription initiation factor TFIID subunit 10 isoform X1 [Syzygium oleosum]|uniref:transcription initiation factor TFIID subunit 10 isoform X1 n=1 Tax=Syzygium oleosum TaxID=219896 RepID=UPI0024B89601|nr:transcription initiation factor TFIID subunit 10 isoform X1 [Syzygium oleosum]